MSTLDSIQAEVKSRGPKKVIPAAQTITLEPKEFCDDFPGRPRAAETFGLRSPSEEDLQLALAEAKRQPEDRQDQQLLIAIVSRCLCEPGDVERAHRMFPMPDLLVPKAFKPLTIRRIWDEIEKARVESSPLFPEATEEDIDRIVLLMISKALDDLDQVRQARCRRYLRFVLDAFEEAPFDG